MSNSSTAVHEWVASQQFDVGIAEVPTERSSLHVEPIESACFCAMRADDPARKTTHHSPNDLDGRPMAALYDEHFTDHRYPRRLCASQCALQPTVCVARVHIRISTSWNKAWRTRSAIRSALPATGLYRDNNGPLVFRPFEPKVPYPFAILRPAFKPSSLLTVAFCNQLAERIAQLVQLPK